MWCPQRQSSSGCQPSVAPSPPQGVTVGAVRVCPSLPCNWEQRLVVLPEVPGSVHTSKLPVSFLALFKRRNIVLLEK